MATDKPAQIFMKIIDEKLRFFKDETNNLYAEIDFPDGKKRLFNIPSKELHDWLFETYTSLQSDFPPPRIITQAQQHAAVMAEKKSIITQVELRFGTHGDNLYIDMVDEPGNVIEISKQGWKLIQSPPILFRKTQSLKALAVPAKENGDPRKILEHLNIKNEDHQMLLVVTLCVLPFSNIVRPILCLIGSDGAAKTMAARMIRSVFDPCVPMENNTRYVSDEIAMEFYFNAVPLFDNITKMPKMVSDMFCQAVTCGGLTKRALFTNFERVTMSYKRPAIITSRELPSEESDFIDRSIIVELDRLTEQQREGECEIIERFNKDLPVILGGCLDTISKAMNIFPTLTFSRLPRLADFAKTGACVAEVLGYGKDRFLDTFLNKVKSQRNEVVTVNNPLFTAITELIDEKGKFEGLTSELLSAIKPYCPYPEGKGQHWPSAASVLGRYLNTIKGNLIDKNVFIETKDKNDGTHVSIFKSEQSETDDIELIRERLISQVNASKVERTDNYSNEEVTIDEAKNVTLSATNVAAENAEVKSDILNLLRRKRK